MKKAQMKFIVTIIALLVFLIIMIFFVHDFITEATEKGEAGVCGLRLYVQSFKKYSGVSLPKTPVECEASDIMIDKSLIKEYLKDAEKAIKKYHDSPSKYYEALMYFEKSESSYWEWAIDKIIADELFECWVLKANSGKTNTVDLFEYDTTNCLICSYIRFKDIDEISKHIAPKKGFFANENYIGSLGAFLRAEEKGYGSSENYVQKNYTDWLNNENQWFPVSEVPYLIRKDTPYAILFAMNTKIEYIPLFGDVQKNWIELRPSDKLTSKYIMFGNRGDACKKTFG